MIEIDNLSFSYGKNAVLQGITMRMEPGRIYGLLGENGVGKTTLLTLMCGLKTPQSGTVKVGGTDPYRREPASLSDQYYLADEVASSGARALDWANTNGVFWPNYSEENFKAMMEEFGVKLDQKMKTMSAGQLKKTHIAFALATGARYIFMDEPTNGLDIPGKTQFRSAIMRFTPEDSTIVISTHQVRDLENIIDPIIILDKQDVLLNASIEEICSRLYFDYGTTLHPESLFTEQLPGGFIQVYPNVNGEESKVNIEVLFNAVAKNKEQIKTLFETK
ncbi:MAG: ATP-binding cassette domain-containing protein [Bacteroidales bacterium]|nr:ATP-binding cassette domain-containing protein [Bacteroidales bacterium]